MADFKVVMYEWQRMCSTMEHLYGDNCCDHCRLLPNGCGAIWEMEENIDFGALGTRIMHWAFENPIPNYPTWEEWLISQGVIKENKGGVGNPLPKLLDPIPADIAKKLGIEPKET